MRQVVIGGTLLVPNEVVFFSFLSSFSFLLSLFLLLSSFPTILNQCKYQC